MPPTHLLFDFFGTLVDYSPSWTEQGYPRSHQVYQDLGGRRDYPEFLAALTTTMAGFARASDADDREFSMTDVGTAFLSAETGNGGTEDPAGVAEFVAAYVGEWNSGVRYPAAVPDLIATLAGEYRLAVVSNTHQADLVPGHLTAMGIRPYFDAVITSVEVGWRKPDPRIYAVSLATLGIDAGAAVFVGDTYDADFVGPERARIAAFLIDPDHRWPVPAERRLDSIVDFPDRLAGWGAPTRR